MTAAAAVTSPPVARSRTRHRGRAALVVLAVLLVLLGGAAVVVNSVGAGIAEKKVAGAIDGQAKLPDTPAVHIGGTFLLQLLAGRFTDVQIGLPADDLGQPGAHADLVLQGVHLPLTAALSGNVHSVTVDRVTGTATLPYAPLTAKLGADGTVAPEGNVLRITKTVTVAGQSVPVSTLARLTVAGNQLALVPGAVTAGNLTVHGRTVPVPADVLDQARAAMAVRADLPKLPFGLHATDVRTAAGGIYLTVAAGRTVLGG